MRNEKIKNQYEKKLEFAGLRITILILKIYPKVVK